jgi:hypothetical protein
MYFVYDNVTEQKALIPMVVVNHNYDTVLGDLEFSFTLMEYGGTCVAKNDECTSLIEWKRNGFKGSFSTISCRVESGNCVISVTCNKCQLSSIATL